jgi:hypothetical protein
MLGKDGGRESSKDATAVDQDTAHKDKPRPRTDSALDDRETRSQRT